MPPLRLTSLLHSALPQVSRPSRALLSSLAAVNGSLLPANQVAAWVGLRNRFQLNRVLRHDGLPPLAELAGCIRVLYWKCRAEETGASLRELARGDHVEPAVAYRLVRRVTGRRWSELRRVGVDVILSRLCEEPRRPPPRPFTGFNRRTTILPIRFPTSAVSPSSAPDHPVGVLATRLQLPDAGLDDLTTTCPRVALVARPRAAAVEVVELPSLKSIGTIPTGPNPTRIVASRAGERAYVTSQFGEEVSVLDVRAGRQVDAISFAGCGHPLAVALARDERRIYVTTNFDRLYGIELGRHPRVTWVPIPLGSQHLTVHPAGHRVAAAGWRHGSITECDATSLRVTRTFHVGGCVQDLTFAPDGNRLFAANLAGWLDVIRVGTGAREARLNFGTPAYGVTFSRDARVIMVSLLLAGRVAMIDAATLRTIAEIQTGGRPRMIAPDRGGPGMLVVNELGWVDLVT